MWTNTMPFSKGPWTVRSTHMDEYLTKFRMVVEEVSEDLLEDLRLCMHLQGWEGIEEFLERLSIRVEDLRGGDGGPPPRPHPARGTSLWRNP